MTDERKVGLARVFDAAADHYEAGPAYSWGQIGAALTEAAAPREGACVLDVAAGAGTTAIPAARAIGPHGYVVAVDLSQELLRLAEKSAAEQGLSNVKTRVGDFESLEYAEESFDVVQCSLGIFFATDIAAALGGLWRLVAPGGRLAVSSWADRGLNDVFEAFGESVREVWPEMPDEESLPWDSISTPDTLSDAFVKAGAPAPTVTRLQFSEPIESQRMWANFMGGGIRGLLDRFTPAQQQQIRAGLSRRLEERGVTSFDYQVLIAVATKDTR